MISNLKKKKKYIGIKFTVLIVILNINLGNPWHCIFNKSPILIFKKVNSILTVNKK